MDWFRVYHGIATDPKLHKASRLAKVSRGLMLGAWIATLEFASQQHDRGSVADLDVETLAYLIDQPVSVATRVLSAMNDARLLAENRVVAWSNRQRSSDDVAARVRSFRAKSSGPNGGEPPNSLPPKETPGRRNVTETRQNRAEQSRKNLPPNGGASAEPQNIEAAIYRRGRELLGPKAGGRITDAKRRIGLGRVAEILDRIESKPPDDANEWFTKAVAGIEARGRNGQPTLSGPVYARAQAKQILMGQGANQLDEDWGEKLATLTREILHGNHTRAAA